MAITQGLLTVTGHLPEHSQQVLLQALSQQLAIITPVPVEVDVGKDDKKGLKKLVLQNYTFSRTSIITNIRTLV